MYTGHTFRQVHIHTIHYFGQSVDDDPTQVNHCSHTETTGSGTCQHSSVNGRNERTKPISHRWLFKNGGGNVWVWMIECGNCYNIESKRPTDSHHQWKMHLLEKTTAAVTPMKPKKGADSGQASNNTDIMIGCGVEQKVYFFVWLTPRDRHRHRPPDTTATGQRHRPDPLT